jgi:hypothetical protein
MRKALGKVQEFDCPIHLLSELSFVANLRQKQGATQ